MQRAVVTQLPPDLRHDDVERGKCQRQAYDVQQRRDFVAPQRSQKITKCDLHNTLFGFNHVNRVGIGDAPRADELHGADDQQHHCPAQGEEHQRSATRSTKLLTSRSAPQRLTAAPTTTDGTAIHSTSRANRRSTSAVEAPLTLRRAISLLRRRISSPR